MDDAYLPLENETAPERGRTQSSRSSSPDRTGSRKGTYRRLLQVVDEIYGISEQQPESTLKQKRQPRQVKKSAPDLPLWRYRKRTVVLLILYVPLLIIPWALTCVLAVRPVSRDSYFTQMGIGRADVSSIHNWATTVRTLNSMATVATIPVISALLTQAAVVYSQRRKRDQKLNMGQVFTLADKRWTDVTILIETFCKSKQQMGSPFLWLAMTLIAISESHNI